MLKNTNTHTPLSESATAYNSHTHFGCPFCLNQRISEKYWFVFQLFHFSAIFLYISLHFNSSRTIFNTTFKIFDCFSRGKQKCVFFSSNQWENIWLLIGFFPVFPKTCFLLSIFGIWIHICDYQMPVCLNCISDCTQAVVKNFCRIFFCSAIFRRFSIEIVSICELKIFAIFRCSIFFVFCFVEWKQKIISNLIWNTDIGCNNVTNGWRMGKPMKYVWHKQKRQFCAHHSHTSSHWIF